MSVVKTTSRFTQVAQWTAHMTGRPRTCGIAVGIILLWGISGPLFGWSDTWQPVINTSTTIITFLMVFLIQNTQTRDSEAIQIKLDELIRATQGAHNALLDLEELEEDDLDQIRASYQRLSERAREAIRCGLVDTDNPEPEAIAG